MLTRIKTKGSKVNKLDGIDCKVQGEEKKQELPKSKQKTKREEMEALAWLEAEGVMLNYFINTKVATKIRDNGGEVEKLDDIS